MRFTDPERKQSPDVRAALESPAEQLSASELEHQEQRFGHDFRDVRIHRDRTAFDSADALNALAYTVGNNIVFGEEYAPGTATGDRLLAHELAHVVQQSGVHRDAGHPAGGSAEAGERAAEAAARKSAPVQPAELGSFPGPRVQRQERPRPSQSGFRPVDDAAAEKEFEKKKAKFVKAGESEPKAAFHAMDEMFAERVAEAGGKRVRDLATPGGRSQQTFVMVSDVITVEQKTIDPKLYNAVIDDRVYNCHSFTMDVGGKAKLQQLAKLAKKIPREGGEIAGKSYFEAQDLIANGIYFSPKTTLEIYPRWIGDDEMRTWLKGYKELAADARVAVGDIVVYALGETLPHSGKVIAVDKLGKPTMIKSKWGEHSLFEHPPSAVPAHYGTPHYYRKK